MTRMPRLALAIPSLSPEPSAASLAMLAGLTRLGRRVQHFRSRARPFGTESVAQVTGLPGRHLDAWLMPPDVCRDVFIRGMRQADLALVEGTLEEIRQRHDPFPFDRPGRLEPIAEALDLPTIGLVPCRKAEGFHLTNVPDRVDALLLDGLECPEDFDSLRKLIQMVVKKPVLGAVEALPEIREALSRTPTDCPLPEHVIGLLADSFLRFADLNTLQNLMESRPFLGSTEAPSLGGGRRFRVAYAMDEAFGGYFPDTLETLEALGAELLEFSPLRSESLPRGVDLVMIGCGFPDRHAEALTANISLIEALKHHVCRGNRIYSEGGGTAYLGRYMTIGDRRVKGAGILPLDATLRTNIKGTPPVSRTLTEDTWLGPKGTVVQGFRSSRWTLRSAPEPDECPGRCGSLTPQGDIFFRHHAIGSQIHLHLAALPQVVHAFAGPHRPSLVLPKARLSGT